MGLVKKRMVREGDKRIELSTYMSNLEAKYIR